MNRRVIFTIAFACLRCVSALSQGADADYGKLKTDLVKRFSDAPPGKFATVVPGVVSSLSVKGKVMALTLDACGGPTGSGYDESLIEFLRKEKIPATLFLSGRWIDANPELVRQLSLDTLFEIENHGLNHQPCSTTGKSRYNIRGTGNVAEVVDEIELNARKIKKITHRKPLFYRSGTATTDESCAGIAGALGESIVSFDLLSGDAVAGTPAKTIEGNLVAKAHPGAIIIMHMNRPTWNGFEALSAAIPTLQAQGYSFIKLQHARLSKMR